MQLVVISALLRNSVFIEEWLAATTFVNKETVYSEKNCFLRYTLDYSLLLWVFS